MNEEEIRAKKLEELKERYQKQQEETQQQFEIERQLDYALSKILTPEAKTRLSNVRLVNQEKYLQVAQGLIMMANQGRIKEKVNETQLKTLLEQLTPKREIKITRKGKLSEET